MKSLFYIVFIALLMVMGAGVNAAQRDHGYVHTEYGSVWRDGFGNCFWSTYWSVDVPECEVADEAAVVEEVQPAPSAMPEPEPVPAPAAAPAEPTVVLQGVVEFDFDRSALKPPAIAELDRLLEGMEDQDLSRIEIDGHTCSIGTEQYNQGLSERRAAAVKRYLVEHGIDETLIVTTGYGETRPIYSNDAEETRCHNRRAETRIIAIPAE